MKRINLKMTYSQQGKKSANCGPCSIKMIADYLGHGRPEGGHYSVQSLNRLLNVSHEWGCEKSDMARVLKRLGLKRTKCHNLADIKKALKAKNPVLTLFIDEGGGGHYAVIKGFEKNTLIFHDSYWGRNFRRSADTFFPKAKTFQNWHWALSSSKN